MGKTECKQIDYCYVFVYRNYHSTLYTAQNAYNIHLKGEAEEGHQGGGGGGG